MMTVSDTAGMIRAIDAQSVETCDDECWCLVPSVSNTKQRFSWSPGDTIVRFPLESEAA